MRVITLEIDLYVAGDVGSQLVPRDEAQISVCALITNKIFFALQNGVQNHGDTLNLVGITVLCRLHLLGMELLEPGCLAKIGTLAGDLEVKVLFTVVLLGERSVCERIGRIVTINQVLDDGARFPESDASVGIIDGWNAAIGIFIGEWFGLDIFLHIKELGLVWHFKLFKNDGNLPGVGSALMRPESNCLRHSRFVCFLPYLD